MQEQKIEFVDIENVWFEPWWKSGWFYAFVALLICLILAIVVYYLYRRGWFVKKLTFDQQALKKLQILNAASYDSSEKIYAAYFQMTMILKIYFAKLYQLQLKDKTDAEIVPSLQGFINPALEPLLLEFLERSFQIKFARDSISEQMLRDDIKFVEKIIKQTCKDSDKVGRF